MSHKKLADAFPLAWPAGWNRCRNPKRGSFSEKSLAKTRDAVLHELKLLGIGNWNVVISTNLRLRRDGLPYSGEACPKDAGVAIYFLRNGKPMVFACDQYARVTDNMWAVCKTIEAIRGISRWGASDMMERSFTGFAALPAPEPEENWWQTVGLTPKATADEIKARFRALAKEHHPDVSGKSPEQWLKISDAFDGIMRLQGAA